MQDSLSWREESELQRSGWGTDLSAVTNLTTARACENCKNPATKKLTWYGTAYGDVSLSPKRRRGRRSRWNSNLGVPSRRFEVSVILCQECERLWTSKGKRKIPEAIFLWPVVLGTWFWFTSWLASALFGSGWGGGFFLGVLLIFAPILLTYNLYPPYRLQDRESKRAQEIIASVAPKARDRFRSMKRRVEEEIKHEQAARLTNFQTVQALGGHKFEELMTRILTRMGYKAHRTKGSADGGIDIMAEWNGERIVIQCKNYKAPIGPGPVRDLYGVMTASGVKRGILVSTSTFSDSALDFGEGKGIEFIDGDQVLTLISKYGVAGTGK